jgi:hypothetical protein
MNRPASHKGLTMIIYPPVGAAGGLLLGLSVEPHRGRRGFTASSGLKIDPAPKDYPRWIPTPTLPLFDRIFSSKNSRSAHISGTVPSDSTH